LAEDLREEDLYQQLFPGEKKRDAVERPMPNWEEVHRDLSRRGVTLRLLWHIVPMSFGRRIERNTRMGMDEVSFKNTIAVGTRRTPPACGYPIREARYWRWIMQA
jgi:hypothetical protein